MYETIPSIKEKDDFVVELTQSVFDPTFTTEGTENIQKFVRDLVGFYVIMEGIFFYAGFAMMLALKRQNKMVGIGEQFEYIIARRVHSSGFRMRLDQHHQGRVSGDLDQGLPRRDRGVDQQGGGAGTKVRVRCMSGRIARYQRGTVRAVRRTTSPTVASTVLACRNAFSRKIPSLDVAIGRPFQGKRTSSRHGSPSTQIGASLEWE